jgi:hypothetical protein
MILQQYALGTHKGHIISHTEEEEEEEEEGAG